VYFRREALLIVKKGTLRSKKKNRAFHLPKSQKRQFSKHALRLKERMTHPHPSHEVEELHQTLQILWAIAITAILNP
jgi:hypothetical protein